MSALVDPMPGRGARRILGGIGRRAASFWSGISAVSAKELRGRMRGRRAFVIVSVYLLLLGAFAFGIYEYLRQQAALDATISTGGLGGPVPFPGNGLGSVTPGYALSASIGHAIFSGLLLVETLLVLVLSPAFTTGAISLEREKQTIDLLVTTPLSTLGMVIGKLFSALVYVFLLILASIPMVAIVFVFGGVGPEDVLRAYVLLFAMAFGMGAVGLFISALVRRTQTATVMTFIVVLALSLGSAAIHEFWTVVATTVQTSANGGIVFQTPNRAPQALLWLNPFVGDLDLICTTAPGGYESNSCDYIAQVTGTPYFGSASTDPCSFGKPCLVDDTLGAVNVIERAANVIQGVIAQPPQAIPAGAIKINAVARFVGGGDVPLAVAPDQQLPSFGFPRDTFWPQSAAAFVVTGVLLTLLSAQLVSPTRRLHLPRRVRRVPSTPPPSPTTDEVTT